MANSARGRGSHFWRCLGGHPFFDAVYPARLGEGARAFDLSRGTQVLKLEGVKLNPLLS